MTQDTWSVKIDPGPGHTRVEVRRGREGQRALLGSLTMTPRDVIDARADLESLLREIGERVTRAVLEGLDRDGHLDMVHPDVIALAVEGGGCAVLTFAHKLIAEQFGVQLLRDGDCKRCGRSALRIEPHEPWCYEDVP